MITAMKRLGKDDSFEISFCGTENDDLSSLIESKEIHFLQYTYVVLEACVSSNC